MCDSFVQLANIMIFVNIIKYSDYYKNSQIDALQCISYKQNTMSYHVYWHKGTLGD